MKENSVKYFDKYCKDCKYYQQPRCVQQIGRATVSMFVPRKFTCVDFKRRSR